MKLHTRRRFLAGVASVGAGAGALGVSRALASSSATSGALDRRYGTTSPPLLSVSLPSSWFVTQQLTDVLDPQQLFSVANQPLPIRQKNVHGLANPALLPDDITLLMLSAFRLAPEMASWSLRTGSPPATPTLADLPPAPYANFPLLSRSWAVYGLQWGVQGFLWEGTAAVSTDVSTMDDVLRSISYDQAL